MARKKLDFTLDEVVEEIVEWIGQLHEYSVECFGKNFYLAALNEPLLSSMDNSDDGTRYYCKEDIESSPLLDEVKQAYHYVFSGETYGDSNDVETFLCGMGAFNYLIKGIPFSARKESKYLFLYDLANARWTFDNGDYLSVKELALLAGVDERTIRNSASSKEDNKLITKKSGGSTVIENKEALRWLNTRPDFKPTQFISDTTLDSPRYFEDAIGFGKFITHCLHNKSLSSKEVASTLGVVEQSIIDLENGIDCLYIDQVTKLSEILEENTPDFIRDYMRVFHLRELADLLGYEYKTDDSTTESMEPPQLTIFEQKLRIEAQRRVININSLNKD